MTRQLSDQEMRLWLRVARTARPIHSSPAEPAAAKPSETAHSFASKLVSSNSATKARSAPKPDASVPPAADHSKHRRVRRGQVDIDATIDLHGYTQDGALRALGDFVLQERMAGSRCLLVITGKGRAGTGVLRRRFLDWINEPVIRPHIAGYSVANARHGGDGAFYLLLKRAP